MKRVGKDDIRGSIRFPFSSIERKGRMNGVSILI